MKNCSSGKTLVWDVKQLHISVCNIVSLSFLVKCIVSKNNGIASDMWQGLRDALYRFLGMNDVSFLLLDVSISILHPSTTGSLGAVFTSLITETSWSKWKYPFYLFQCRVSTSAVDAVPSEGHEFPSLKTTDTGCITFYSEFKQFKKCKSLPMFFRGDSEIFTPCLPRAFFGVSRRKTTDPIKLLPD